MSKYTHMVIGNKLVELGMEETYARLVINNVKKQAPTLEYHLSQLERLSDDFFEKTLMEL